jgi:hypothetical protein
MLFLFFNKDETSMKTLEENYVVPKDKKKAIINKLKGSKGSKVILRLQHPFNYVVY